MSTVRILHLYPRELGINGDAGNVIALAERARWRGIGVDLLTHEPGAELPSSADLVHIGSGPLSAQRAVYDDILRIAGRLREWRDAGVPILAVAGGWQLLGRELVMPDGRVLAGGGVFPSRAVLGETRHVGEMIVRSAAMGALAGFENHSARTELEGGDPLGRVLSGTGNDTASEGVMIEASIGTHLHGPVLPMNPRLADEMLATAVGSELPAVPETDRVDRYATNARRAVADRLGVSLL